ncbi:hypothetical protein CHH28_01855 [Bacterioplanes sanyensis]|uniref:Uncharacterized protein n=1 Tax=Bacterioplanes sanyensis TaxID=1249553 RepID=A0A222FFS9_9GAMM|nr:hypothetical protein CHH28_01855 [Bacterioplanes sanyensis]
MSRLDSDSSIKIFDVSHRYEVDKKRPVWVAIEACNQCNSLLCDELESISTEAVDKTGQNYLVNVPSREQIGRGYRLFKK